MKPFFFLFGKPAEVNSKFGGITLATFHLVCLILTLASKIAAQSQYTVEQVTTGSANHRAPGINSSGEIVWMQESGQGWQVFSSTRGQLTSPSGNYSEAQYPTIADDGSFVCFRPGSLPCTSSGYLLRYPSESTVEFCSRNGASHRDPIPQSGISSDGSKVIWGRKFYGTSGLLQTEKFFVNGTQVSGDLSDWHNPSVNRNGEFVYDFANEIYSSVRGALTPGVQPSINDAGDVAYVSGSDVAVLRATGATASVGPGSDPNINAEGTVVFERSVDGYYQIFKAKPAPDLLTDSLTWNNALGGLDFQYTVAGGPLGTATTAKLFWANGPTTAEVISATPIFTQNIPAGASGSSGIIHVPGSVLGAPPADATYVLLALDYESQLPEADESNNSSALALCSVGPLMLQHIDDPGYDESCLAVELRQALSCFRDAVSNLGGSVNPTSGYRPTDYQSHLYELRTKFIQLSQINGIIAYIDAGRPQLSTTPATTACQMTVDSVNHEIRLHKLVPRTDGTPAVAAPGSSLHELGRAVDLTVSGLPGGITSDTLARNCGLYRPYPVNDRVHYELTGETPKREITFTGHSPINILVQDPAGRQIGFDPTRTSAVNEIGPYATYSGPGSTPQVIQIFPNEALPGKYQLSGVGTGSGSFIVSAQIASEDGSGPLVNKILAAGTATVGEPLASIPPFDCILSTISLQIDHSGQVITLLAPPWATNIVVEQSSDLLTGSWSLFPQPINPTNGLVLTNLTNASKFFRLRIE